LSFLAAELFQPISVFPLRQGVKWHDGKPFTAQDVKCTWDLLAGKTKEKPVEEAGFELFVPLRISASPS